MKKWIALTLACLLALNLVGIRCEAKLVKAEDYLPDSLINDSFEFDSLDDAAFLQYLEDSIYASLEAEYASEESMFIIDDVSVKYVSKEYLEETAYNTKANIFFGYSLEQINEVFQGQKYVFTLSDSGETIVQEFMEIPNDVYNQIIRNVLIGAGVILICVAVTVITAGAAAPATAAGGSSVASLAAASTVSAATKVNLIFAASAHSAISFAASGAAFAGATTLVTRGLETRWDMDAMVESAALSASNGFKCGAIIGAAVGGVKEGLMIHKASRGALTPREAERAAQAKYGGREQVTYLNGEEVPYGTPGAVRPDVITGHEAVEVKCYDLTHSANLYELKNTLTTEISQRMINLPEGMTQRIVLNVEGRGYTGDFVQGVVTWIQEFMEPIYPDIPIDVMGAVL